MQNLGNTSNSWKELVADLVKTLLSPIIIVCAFWYLTHDLKGDIDRIDQYHREDMKQVNDNMAKINDRWIELFKQFHILDKNGNYSDKR